MHGGDLVQPFRTFNDVHFGGRLSEPAIAVRGLELGVKARYFNAAEAGGRALIVVSTASALRGGAHALDMLLHEMCHHAVAELCRDDSSAHGVVFCNVVNEVGRSLGLRRVQPETDHALRWPETLRPRGYYLGGR